MDINPVSPVSFGYSNKLKTLYLQGKIKPKWGIYGDRLTKDTVSLEHLQPRSKGGKTQIENLALASQKMNNLRGNKPLEDFLTPKNLVQYINQFIDIDIPEFNGKEYAMGILKTIGKIIGGKNGK